MKYLPFLLLIPLVLSCTKIYKASLNPDLYVNPSDIGGNHLVGFKVVDLRRDRYIGQGIGKVGPLSKFKIESMDDVTEILEDRVKSGLKEIGFRPRAYQQVKKRKLRLDILRMKSAYRQKISGIKETMRVAFRAVCLNHGKEYKQVYRSVEENEYPLVATDFPNEKLINMAVSIALQKIFEDKKLIACLAHG